MVRVLGKSNSTQIAGFEKMRCDVIDSDKARQATQALQFQTNLMVPEDYQNASPPRCQSETDMSCDSDGDSLSSCSGGQPTSPMNERHAEVVQRRKERRRERNKLSAQAYRQRKREEVQNQDKVVYDLEEQKKRLQEKVAELEQEKTYVENFLRNRVQYLPWFSTTNNNNQSNVDKNDNNNHCWHDNTKTHCCCNNQDNGNMTYTTCGSTHQGQGQPMMTLPSKPMMAS